MADCQPHIKALYTYPIKSLRGCSLSSINATTTGFNYDRRFMLIRAEDGENMHVSSFTEMCLFTTELARSDGKEGGKPNVINVRYGKNHVFKKPDEKIDQEVLRVPLEPDLETLNSEQVEVSMHSSATYGYDMGEKYNSWFSRRFGYEVRLLYVAGNRRKVLGNVTPKYVNATAQTHNDAASSQGWLSGVSNLAGNIVSQVTFTGSAAGKENRSSSNIEYEGVDDGIGFADCAPFLVVNSKSWENANRRLPDDVELDITKFRPNIIVDGSVHDFEEDFWAELQVGDIDDGVRIVLTQNCHRCNSLNVDYDTGVVGTGEAGKVFKKLQKDRRVDLGAKYSPVFGRYGFLARKNGLDRGEVEIKVGDAVAIVKRNDERTRFRKLLPQYTDPFIVTNGQEWVPINERLPRPTDF